MVSSTLFGIRRYRRLRKLNPAEIPHGTQVFGRLPVGASIQPGAVGAAPRGFRRHCRHHLDHHRPLRVPRSETGTDDLLRRVGIRRPVDPGGARRLCRDLAERLAGHERDHGGADARRRDPGVSRLPCVPVPQAAEDPRHHHRPRRPAALRGAGAAADRRRHQFSRLFRPLLRGAAAHGLSGYRAGGAGGAGATRL